MVTNWNVVFSSNKYVLDIWISSMIFLWIRSWNFVLKLYEWYFSILQKVYLKVIRRCLEFHANRKQVTLSLSLPLFLSLSFSLWLFFFISIKRNFWTFEVLIIDIRLSFLAVNKGAIFSKIYEIDALSIYVPNRWAH